MEKKFLVGIAVAIVIIAAVVFSFIPNNATVSNQEEVNEQDSIQTVTEETQGEENQIESDQTPEETPQENTGPTTHTVEMRDFQFSPQDIIIKKGDTVEWINKGKGKHYVLTSSGLRILDSKNINPGESWSYTFEEVGHHKYFSPIYTKMSGTVSVTEV